jgi:NTP pyrophosphatase (non-canonical NTP hydrolase)
MTIKEAQNEVDHWINTTNRDLADEIADVMFVLICLANQTGIDLTEVFKKNIAKKKTEIPADIS